MQKNIRPKIQHPLMIKTLNKLEIEGNSTNLTGEGNGNPLQYSCLENSLDRGAW